MTRLLTLLLLTACTGDAPSDTDTDSPDTLQLALTFDAQVDGTPARCGQDYNVGSPATTVQLADARLFVSNVQLRNSSGAWVPMALDPSDWQMDAVALLDFEDGTAGCADSGTSETHNTIEGSLPQGTYDAVRFDVGVPFELNHNDSANAPAPLNAPGMFWTWQGGYKFVRVDFTIPSTSSRWNVHLGSTGCVSNSPVDAPEAECNRTNRPSIELDLDPMVDSIQLDLAGLVAGTDITANTLDTPPGCQSNPMEPDDCTQIFSSLGLSFPTGACTNDCTGQTVFGRAP